MSARAGSRRTPPRRRAAPARALVIAGAVACALAVPASRAADPEGPQFVDIGAPDGAERTAFRSRPYDRYDLPIGRYGPEAPNALTLEGAVTMQAWRLAAPEASTAGTIDSYRRRLAAQGYEVILDCRTEECGGFDFRFSVALLPAPAMLMDTADFAQLSLRRLPPEDAAATPVYASVLASRVLGRVYVQTVTVTPGESTTRVTEAPSIETAPEVLILPQDEKSLYDTLVAEGHVQIEGLVFDTGGARLSPGSSEALDMLARLLARNEDIAVAIVGHSDNQGSLEANIALSRKRAEAVMAALAARGVEPRRMGAHGVGWLAPRSSNDTPAGRALNRRVELVLR